MFLKEEFDYSIIDDSISVDYLREWCQQNGVGIKPNSNAEVWAMFTQYYAQNHGLDVVSATSMAYIISSLFGGFGVSASTEMYIREEEITFDSIEYLNHLRDKYSDVSEEAIASMLFMYVFRIYQNHIYDYEYKDHSLCVRLGESSMVRFMAVDGDTKTDKFLQLIQFWNENHSD